jgi:hypothetical protein
MPRTNANTKKAALHWDVFVTPGIPIVTRDKAARRSRDILSGDGVDAHLWR